ncbi:MAG: SMP-30/gluconolactonase/LRE family protein [Fimbriimonas sp.]
MTEPVCYPDPRVISLDPRFDKYRIGSAAIERLWTGSRWAEGPVYFGDARCLLFSDIPNNRILRWDEETGQVTNYRADSNFANGNTRDQQGRLITCEHGSRRVTRTEYDGTVTVLMDSFDGKPLNAPNDVVVRSDGSIWFTDPGYGLLSNYEGNKLEPELPMVVYRIDPNTGEGEVVVEDLERPNGLCFSPDERLLYIADSGQGKIWVYDVVANKLQNGRVFADLAPSIPDGIRCDVDGNIWSSAGWSGAPDDGVRIYASDGDLIGKIALPEVCANLTFGGRKRNRLFFTASQSLYSLFVEAQGIG